ncbi:unnamed protein product [Mycena citricolor]|uniref:FZ domain-containing protein n=1 Tax=Mycena citricolor TaxID=2018698 RepID=A0AAD2HIU7_9AGAR|nr:unnamed protein product [Mycena citricolor]
MHSPLTHRICSLPSMLLLLLFATLSAAQTRQTLSLNAVANERSPNPPFFTIPAAPQLAISVTLCASTTNAALPRFFLANSSSTASPDSSGGVDVFEIPLDRGYGQWTGPFPQGGVVGVENAGNVPFQIGVSAGDAPMHEVLADPPLFGDSTATQAILFSPSFASFDFVDPTYPNYTLSMENLTPPAPPPNPPNFRLIITPTSDALSALQQTSCALSSLKSSGTVANQTLWSRDTNAWRSQWMMTGLAASTNYTVFVIQDSFKVTRSIYFTTKSSSFSCPLVSNLPYCPSISYAVPLPALPSSQLAYNATNLPTSISAPLLSSLTNFTTTLTTFACGRDFYSPLVTCADCQRAYRTWLCAISFPRCADPAAAPPSAALLQAQAPDARNAAFPPGSNYTQLLPCLETCTAVDRACPHFLGFKCPVPRFNAAASYGVGYIDSPAPGVQGQGLTGAWSDDFGNVWCAGSP